MGLGAEDGRLTVLEAGHSLNARMRFDLSRQELFLFCRDSAPDQAREISDDIEIYRPVGMEVALRDMFVVQSKSEVFTLSPTLLLFSSLFFCRTRGTLKDCYVLVSQQLLTIFLGGRFFFSAHLLTFFF